MKKYRVTEKQKKFIENEKTFNSLFTFLESWSTNDLPPFISKMADNEIAAVWLGIAEVGPKQVEPWEAYKAVWEGKTVLVEYNGVTSRLMNWQHSGPEFNIQDIKNKGTEFYIIEEESQ